MLEGARTPSTAKSKILKLGCSLIFSLPVSCQLGLSRNAEAGHSGSGSQSHTHPCQFRRRDFHPAAGGWRSPLSAAAHQEPNGLHNRKPACSSFNELSGGDAVIKPFQVHGNRSSQKDDLIRKHPQLTPANMSRSNISCSHETHPVFTASMQTVWHFTRVYVHTASQAFSKYIPYPPYPRTHEPYLHEPHAEDLQSERQE